MMGYGPVGELEKEAGKQGENMQSLELAAQLGPQLQFSPPTISWTQVL